MHGIIPSQSRKPKIPHPEQTNRPQHTYTKRKNVNIILTTTLSHYWHAK